MLLNAQRKKMMCGRNDVFMISDLENSSYQREFRVVVVQEDDDQGVNCLSREKEKEREREKNAVNDALFGNRKKVTAIL